MREALLFCRMVEPLKMRRTSIGPRLTANVRDMKKHDVFG